MNRIYRATMRITGDTLFGRLAFTFLLICAIALGAAVGFLFVYTSDLPEIRALEDYRPNVVTELYGDDGQLVGSFALQRRILGDLSANPQSIEGRGTHHRGPAFRGALGRGYSARAAGCVA